MTRIFHEIEKKIIRSLRESDGQTDADLALHTGLSPDQIRRGIEWLRLKKLVILRESGVTMIRLGGNGLEAFRNGLPEYRLLELLRDGPKTMDYIRKRLGGALGPAMGMARKNGWITVSSDLLHLGNFPDYIPGRESLDIIRDGSVPVRDISETDLLHLKGRPDYIIEETARTVRVSLAKKASSVKLQDDSGAIDVEADVSRVHAARTHILRDVINEIREIFATLGFSEIRGDMVQSSFWNFDALFTPQDHPAREMHDTFYLDGYTAKNVASRDILNGVSRAHRDGWQYDWSAAEAKRLVLRTHTTCVTIKHLAESRPDEARVFSLGRVFRNEKVSYKHLVEFNQIEGVVVGRDATLRNLMGIQKEFYRRIGLTRVKFWPTFFPYTEPSLQTMVYNDRLGKWVEMFGMGIFRPEVTEPLGIPGPVLAWGGGIERIAMLKYSLDDVRELYGNDMDWLRGVKCQ